MEYKECEALARKYLWYHKQQVTDETIGDLISVILMSDHNYNDTIGNIHGYRKMNLDFAIKDLIKKNKKNKRMVYVNDYTPLENELTTKKSFPWEDLQYTLTKREYDILISKYLDRETLEEIGKKYNLTAERIRQILKKSIEKIKNEYS